MARALSKSDRRRARVLAEQARDGYRGAEEADENELAEVKKWLRKHDR